MSQVRFPAIARRGVLFGLSLPQTAGVVAATVVFLAGMWSARSAGSIFLTIMLASATAAVGLWPISGLTPAGWAVRGARFAAHGLTGRREWMSPPPPTLSIPPHQFATVAVASTLLRGAELGVLVDEVGNTRRGVYTAALQVSGTSFAAASADDRDRRIAAWSAFVAALGGSLVSRIQVIARVVPADPAALQGVFDARPAPDESPWAVGYQQLVDQVAAASVDTQILVVVAVDVFKTGVAAEVKRLGGGREGKLALLSAEVERVWDHLASADVSVTRPLTAGELSEQVRSTLDPFHEADAETWPSALVDSWATVTCDAARHAAFWVAEWSQRPVEAGLFMSPLLLRAMRPGHVRTFSLLIEPAHPDVALRRVERARMVEDLELEGRRRAGFGLTARRAMSAARLAEQEQELVEGATDCRFTAVVVVSAASDESLAAGCVDAQRACHQAHLRLRRQYGAQAEILGAALPLTRGFKKTGRLSK